MKNLKMLVLAAALALTALVGASLASAAEFYSTGATINAGTVVKGSLASGTSAQHTTTDTSSSIKTCTSYTFEGRIDPYTGGNATITITSEGWGGCSFTTDTLTNGSLSVNSSGTVSGSGSVTTVNIGVSCRYGYGTGTTLGTLNAGKVPIKSIVNEQEPKQFLCPDTTELVLDFVITSPHNVTVK